MNESLFSDSNLSLQTVCLHEKSQSTNQILTICCFSFSLFSPSLCLSPFFLAHFISNHKTFALFSAFISISFSFVVRWVLITFQLNTSISGLDTSFERRYSLKNTHTHACRQQPFSFCLLFPSKGNEVDWKVTI